MNLSIDQMLREMVEQKASDLHVKAGSPPGYRIDGDIVAQEKYGTLTPEHTKLLCQQIMSAEQWARYEQEKDIDFSYALKDCARFRVNALTQRNSMGLVIRQIPDVIPDHKQLGLPQICLDLAAKPRGLVLVTGPTGSGKSTTLAAMINFINETESGHILTMEDPLEFIHRDKKCFVTQRQIGSDSPSFKEALRRALRQDPDVILIGEMRDLETISMAITAAETGHLVFGTLHTTSAISTVDRIIDVFPTDAQQQVRVQLAGTLQGVISQTLVPKVGGGRVAAREILVATDGVRALIRDSKSAQILNLMQTGKAFGMSTLEDELLAHVTAGFITPDDAVSRANRPEEIRKRIAELPSRPAASNAGGPARATASAGRPAPGATAPAAAPRPASSPLGSGWGSTPARPPLGSR
ncbi:MAG: hypothetical protein RL148_1618 [Planctomycetota bacterium]|jgi:twitching motility protein PilT